jgi:PAS domain S-box-containing protein
MKLTSRLLILLILAVLLPMTIMSIVLIIEQQRAYTDVILAHEQEIASRLAHSIDSFMREKRDTMQMAGSAFLLQAMSRVEGDFFFALLLKNHLDVHWVAVVDPSGHELTRVSRTEAVLETDLLDRAGDPWLERAMRGIPVTSPVFFSTTNEPQVVTYLPILLYGEKLLGVIVGEISLQTLWEQILRAEVSAGKFAFVVAQDGTVVAHPEKLSVRQKRQFSEMPSVQRVLAGQTGTAVYHDPVLHTSVAAAFMPLRTLDGGIVVVQPYTELFAVRHTLLTRMIVIVVVCLLVALGVGGMFGYRLVQPMLGLIRDIRTIRVQEGSTVLPVDMTGGSEIDVLTRSFAEMTRELRIGREALMSAKTYTDNILASMSDMLFVLSWAGHIQTVNTAVCARLGYEESELLGHTMGLIWSAGWLSQRREFDELCRAGFVRNVETTLQAKGGTPIPVLLSGSVMHTPDGTIQGIVCVARDITERKQAEHVLQEAHDRLEARVQERTAELLVMNAQLQQEVAERQRAEEARSRLEEQLYQSRKMEALGTLAGGIAHDFNNILAVMLGYSELALFELPRQAPSAQHLQEVLTAGKRAKNLVQQILTFSRKSENQRKPISLHILIQEALTLLRAVLPSTIDIHQRLDRNAGTVFADPSQMHQVLLNLFSNAEHAMRAHGGVLEVQLDAIEADEQLLAEHAELRPGAYVRLLVRDTGHGMDAAVMQRIFEPFFTTKGVGEGSGMGLAVVHGIITNHGGVIAVQSAPGQGTTLTIYLPRIAEIAAEENPLPQALPHGSGYILFLDDERVIVRWGKEMLERLGYVVEAYTASDKALEAIREAPYRFDLVITDQTMPHMTGEKFVEELRQLRPDMPIILCTGFSHTMDAEKAHTMGIAAFCMKPLVAHDLVDTIQRVMAQSTTSET